MTIETPATPAPLVELRTGPGTGLTVPIAKALSHLVLVREATVREWDMPLASAKAELNEAVSHFETISRGALSNLLTYELLDRLDIWTATITNDINEIVRDDTIEHPMLADLIVRTWSLLSFIDRELAGLESAEPGTRP